VYLYNARSLAEVRSDAIFAGRGEDTLGDKRLSSACERPRGYRVASSTLRGLVPLGTAVGGACRGSQGSQRRTCALQPSRMLPPSRPAWSAIGSGQTARGPHTATLLTPGSVVVAGGTNVPGLRSG
jgi:hypothetical protein